MSVDARMFRLAAGVGAHNGMPSYMILAETIEDLRAAWINQPQVNVGLDESRVFEIKMKSLTRYTGKESQ